MWRAPRETLEVALALAARAPSAHNTQPWRVRAEPERVVVLADPARWLRHGDPTRRDLRLSLGAFVEALRLALAAAGARFDPTEPPAGAEAALQAAGSAGPEPLAASLLRRRQTSRLAYSPRAPDAEAITALAAAARSAGLDLVLAGREAPERADWEALSLAAAREAWLDTRAVRELGAWIRFDPEGVLRPADGLSTHCLGLGPGETAAMAALLRPSLWRAAHAVFAAPLVAGALARAEGRLIAAAPYLGLLVAPADAGAAGGALLRVWLEATRLGLVLAPGSSLIDRRGWELGKRLGVSPTRFVLAFRLGRSVPAPWSGRRPVGAFTSWSAPS